MKTAVHIGAQVSKESAENFGAMICKIFESGRKNQMDQSTVVEAIRAASGAFDVSNCTLSNSTINGDEKHVHFHEDEE